MEIPKDKIRPVIVVSKPYGKHNIVAVVPISSKDVSQPVDVSLSGWNQSGLLRPSTARVHRITTIEESKLISALGPINLKDKNSLKQALFKFLSLKITY